MLQDSTCARVATVVLCSSVEVLEGGSSNLVSWDLSSSAPSLAESGL